MSLTATAPLTATEEADLITRAQAGDEAATARLVTSQLRWLRATAASHARRSSAVSVDDLVSAGVEALLSTIATFDPRARLHTAAAAAVRAAMSDEANAAGWTLAVPSMTRKRYLRAIRATETATEARAWAVANEQMTAETFDAIHSAATTTYAEASTEVLDAEVSATASDYADPAATAAQRDSVLRALASLTDPRHRRVIELTVLADNPLTVREAAEVLGISHPTVIRARDAALAVMRGALA